FLSRGPAYSLFLTSTEAVMAMGAEAKVGAIDPGGDATVVRMQYLGANATPEVTGLNELPGKVNYFVGEDSSQWQTNVPTYEQVAYHDLYAGIDLVYYGNAQHQLEYDFVVSPGADPAAIQLGFAGGGHLAIDASGRLVLRAGSLELHQPAPVTYQEVGGARHVVPSSFVLAEGNRVGFAVGAYDADLPLVIDPVLSYSSYLGGNNTDSGQAITADADGNAFVAGYTFSTNFPTLNASQPTKAGAWDAFVTKVGADGKLAFSTYLGGFQSDYARSIALDPAGNIYLTGNTQSPDSFPLLNPLQPKYGRGIWDAFVAK